jgi:ATP-dependent exoDNAse (exonuclease V) beta subunit
MSQPFTAKGALRLSASAGSGKTFTLTQLYLRRALLYPDAFKGILAITFTNKAANELKDRIIEKLRKLALSENLKAEDEALGFTDVQKLRESAQASLNQILHNYDDFQVSTIDSFFQSLFSKMAFEANLPYGLKTEIDIGLVKREVLQKGIMAMPEPLKKLMLENVLENLGEKGKKWKAVGYLKSHLLEYIFADKVVDFHIGAEGKWLEDKTLEGAKAVMVQYQAGLKSEIQNAAKAVFQEMEKMGLSRALLHSDLDNGFLKELTTIEGQSKGQNLFKPSASHAKGKLYREPKSKKLSPEERQLLEPLLMRLGELNNNEKNKANYFLANRLQSHLAASRLLLFFREVLKSLNEQQDRFLLNETKFVLKALVNDSEVPYLFEKLGQQVHTMLIDEFQDTDLVQWQVIRPLAKAIVDKGGFFSVVGDVKQSIYYWRGAESTLFKTGLDESLKPIPVEEQSLSFNFRSEENIVAFNNLFFREIADTYYQNLLDSDYVIPDPLWEKQLKTNFGDLEQKIPDHKKTRQGFIDFRIRVESKEQEENSQEDSGEEEAGGLAWMVKEIKSLYALKIPFSDMAILVRNNTQTEEIIALLDAEKQKKDLDFPIEFTAYFDNKAGAQTMLDFLATGMAALEHPEDFFLVQLQRQLETLNAPESWWMDEPGKQPDWFQSFKNLASHGLNDLEKLHLLCTFFELDTLPGHQDAIIQFYNLLIQFRKDPQQAFPDFKTWWMEKGVETKISGDQKASGIQIMTIHKSKGLDFGVVIFPFKFGTKQVAGWVENDFWPYSDLPPWNAHPLLFAKGKREFLHSDPGPEFNNLIFKNALETLNIWYVGFTRPRYGLIIDLSFKSNPLEQLKEPTSTQKANLGFIAAHWINNARETLFQAFPDTANLENDVAEFVFRFRAGNAGPAEITTKNEPSGISKIEISPAWRTSENIPWAIKPKPAIEQATGLLVHSFLENLRHPDDWEKQYFQFTQRQNTEKDLEENGHSILIKFFENEFVKNCFSDAYELFTEQEFLTKKGRVLRPDRVLRGKDGWLIIDFKTGAPDADHMVQVRDYLEAAREILEGKIQAFLIYTDPAEVQEVC